MADLSYIERANIEAFLGMKSGYVMDISVRTFGEFVGEATGLDIFAEKYQYASNTKSEPTSWVYESCNQLCCGQNSRPFL